MARGYVQLSIFGKVIAQLAAKCSVLIEGSGAKVTGGKKTILKRTTAKEWLDYYGVPVKNGVAILYKAVGPDFESGHDHTFFYKPGTKPEADGWNEMECSNGLHFCAHPKIAQGFNNPEGVRFVGCPVKVSEIMVHPEGAYPQKVKAPRVCGAVFEVDEDGNRIKKGKK